MSNNNPTPLYFDGDTNNATNPIIYFVYVSNGDSLHATTAKVKTQFDEFLNDKTDGEFNGLTICQTASFYFNDQELEFSSARRFPVVVQIEGTFKHSFLEDLMGEISSNLLLTGLRIVSFEEAPHDLQVIVSTYSDETVDITEREITVRRLGTGSALEIY